MVNTCMKSVALIIMMCICSGCGKEAKTECDIDAVEKARKEIQESLRNWSKAFNEKNLAKVTEIYTPDVVGSYQGEPDMYLQQLEQVIKRAFQNPNEKHHYDFVMEDIEYCGNLAVAWITWTLEEELNGESITLNERSMEVFKKQPNGEWKIIRFGTYPMIKHKKDYGIYHD